MINKTTCLMIILLLPLAGCAQRKAVSAPRDVDIVLDQLAADDDDSVHLAMLILKPKRKPMEVLKDPFAPLLGSDTARPQKDEYEQNQIAFAPSLGKVRFMGVSSVEGEYVALIIADKAKGAFRVNDMLKDYKVKSIDNDQVVLSNGSKLLTLRRGAER